MARNSQETQLGFETPKKQKKSGFWEIGVKKILGRKQIDNFFKQIQAPPEKDPDQPSEAEKAFFKKFAKDIKKEEREKAAKLRANKERSHWKKVAKQSGLSLKKEKRQKQEGEGENWKKVNQDIHDAYALIIELPGKQCFAYLIPETKSKISIGSAQSNDIILKADGLAKHHAQLEFKDQCLCLKGPASWRYMRKKPRFSLDDIKDQKISNQIIEPDDKVVLGQAEITYKGFAESNALQNHLFGANGRYANMPICELRQVFEPQEKEIVQAQSDKIKKEDPALPIHPSQSAQTQNIPNKAQLKEKFHKIINDLDENSLSDNSDPPAKIVGMIIHDDAPSLSEIKHDLVANTKKIIVEVRFVYKRFSWQ